MTYGSMPVPRRRDRIAAHMHARRDAWREVQPDLDGRTPYLLERAHVANAAAHRAAEEALDSLRDAGVPMREPDPVDVAPALEGGAAPSERAAASRAQTTRSQESWTLGILRDTTNERIAQIEAVQGRLAAIYQRTWDRLNRDPDTRLNPTIAVDRATLPLVLRGG